ncbi:MAG: 23S rRNA (guanosine(2251)-2'-O)-methyltransferase RlmB [Proteobacteria bacterium]|nr:23S rRNA (guanosine(2251)-2'-O)-methyltransferase RlmB [Pseudomonadota bacterium]
MSYIHGLHAVTALLEGSPDRVRALYVQNGRRDQRIGRLMTLAQVSGIRFQVVDRRWLDSRAEGPHQGVVADCHELRVAQEADLELHWPLLPTPLLLLVLDGVTDPRNLGACLRSANAAGVQVVLLPKRNSAPLSAVALKAAAGAAEDLFIVEVTNLARRLAWLKEQGVWIIGADGQAEHAHTEPDFSGSVALVMGGEEKGMRRLTREHCDELVRIPMAGAVESLNVSVATAVILFEIARKRSLQAP